MCPAPWTNSPEPCLVLDEDYTVSPRTHPVSHPPLDAPLCATCRHLDLSFFDPSCPGCLEILKSRETRQIVKKKIQTRYNYVNVLGLYLYTTESTPIYFIS